MAYATVAELAGALKVRVTPENTPTLQSCLDAAAAEINHDIDVPPAALTSGRWLYSTATVAADPGPGYFRLDKSSLPAVKKLYLDIDDADGTDRAAGLLTITTDDLIQIRDYATDLDWARYTVTGAAIDRTGWVEIPMDYESGSGTLQLAAGESALLGALRLSTQLGNRLALAKRVNILRGVEWYKANDAAFGVIGFDQTGALQAPRDGFNRHAYTLTPLKKQWGLA